MSVSYPFVYTDPDGGLNTLIIKGHVGWGEVIDSFPVVHVKSHIVNLFAIKKGYGRWWWNMKDGHMRFRFEKKKQRGNFKCTIYSSRRLTVCEIQSK